MMLRSRNALFGAHCRFSRPRFERIILQLEVKTPEAINAAMYSRTVASLRPPFHEPHRFTCRGCRRIRARAWEMFRVRFLVRQMRRRLTATACHAARSDLERPDRAAFPKRNRAPHRPPPSKESGAHGRPDYEWSGSLHLEPSRRRVRVAPRRCSPRAQRAGGPIRLKTKAHAAKCQGAIGPLVGIAGYGGLLSRMTARAVRLHEAIEARPTTAPPDRWQGPDSGPCVKR